MMEEKKNPALRPRRSKIPKAAEIAAVAVDHENNRQIIIKTNMLKKQIWRDGPKICRSFDNLAKEDIDACSALLGRTYGMLVRHLPKDDQGFRATCARLLSHATQNLIASIEVARHGYRQSYGVLGRTLIETLATVISICVRDKSLEEFYAGTLQSTKCIGAAKDVLPPLGRYYGGLSRQFVHIGQQHAIFEPTLSYKPDDEALPFILGTIRANTWLIYVVAELVFHDEISSPRYWFAMAGGQVAYNPSDAEREWMRTFLRSDPAEGDVQAG